MKHEPISQEDREKLRANLMRSTPQHEVVLSSEDGLKLLDGYEEVLRTLEMVGELTKLALDTNKRREALEKLLITLGLRSEEGSEDAQEDGG